MARPGATLDELFSRAYRPGAVFGPRVSPGRRWTMRVVLVFLVTLIVGYWYFTDTKRVRVMAEKYLTQLTGGRVRVRSATLSIFEGLRLDGVTMYTDRSEKPNRIIFHAGTIHINYNPKSIFSGQLEATRIVALDPQFFLVEDVDTSTWNWQNITRDDDLYGGYGSSGATAKMPEILLRNVRVNYTRMRGGKPIDEPGRLDIEGTIRPEEDRVLGFTAQSRSGSKGFVVRGSLNLQTRVVTARLEDFEYGRDIELMLPEQVRNFCMRHKLAGKLSVFPLRIEPDEAGSRFRIEADLENVAMAFYPEDWLSEKQDQRLQAMRRTYGFMSAAGLDSQTVVTRTRELFDPGPIMLEGVSGHFIFTQDGVEIQRLSGYLEGNRFTINARIAGYAPESPGIIDVASDRIIVPSNPRYLNSLPPEIREAYEQARPNGKAAIAIRMERRLPGGELDVRGTVDIKEGNLFLAEFPYPLRNVEGRIAFGYDPKTRMKRLEIIGLKGQGLPSGPNRDQYVQVDGFVAPLGDPDPQIHFVIQADGITSEPTLNRALTPEAKDAFKLFDAPGKGEFPQFTGDFRVYIDQPAGPNAHLSADVDMNLASARGRLVFFPYPVENLTGEIYVAGQYAVIRHAVMRKGSGWLCINGIVRYGFEKPTEPDLWLTARDIPVDEDLLSALPPKPRQWLREMGIRGKIDLDGTIARDPKAPQRTFTHEDDILYDLKIHLKDVSAWPGGQFAAGGISGTLQVRPGKLVVTDLKGKRGDAELSGSGLLTWDDRQTRLVLTTAGKNVLFDADLHKLLPVSWQEVCDEIRMKGTLDTAISYSGRVDGGKDEPATRPADAILPTGFEATFTPVKLSINPKVVPVQLDQVSGEVTISPTGTVLKNLAAKRASGGTVALDGKVAPGARPLWELKLGFENTVNDKELRAALPPSVSKMLEVLAVEGKLSAKFDKLNYRPTSSEKANDGELDLAGTIQMAGNAMNIGFPLSKVFGSITLECASRDGKLGSLKGSFDVEKAMLADRQVTGLKGDMTKPADAQALYLRNLAAQIAGGHLDGRADLVFPDNGASRYGVQLVLRNADVRELMGPSDHDIKGKLTANIGIQGDWGDPNSRRGSGEVQVIGKEMYKIPLLLGLFQITNLTLPISSPFEEAVARYAVEGQKVTFDQIELRASNIMMKGGGWLDFGTRKVKMTFVTDNPNAWKVPFLHEILQGARQELLQIHVTGTVQDPKVTGSMMNTFSTTIDEVLGNGERGGKRPKSK